MFNLGFNFNFLLQYTAARERQEAQVRMRSSPVPTAAEAANSELEAARPQTAGILIYF